jgi:hypothetical protein
MSRLYGRLDPGVEDVQQRLPGPPRVRKFFLLDLESDTQPVPAKMADGFSETASLLCCRGTSCSMGKCVEM